MFLSFAWDKNMYPYIKKTATSAGFNEYMFLSSYTFPAAAPRVYQFMLLLQIAKYNTQKSFLYLLFPELHSLYVVDLFLYPMLFLLKHNAAKLAGLPFILNFHSINQITKRPILLTMSRISCAILILAALSK